MNHDDVIRDYDRETEAQREEEDAARLEAEQAEARAEAPRCWICGEIATRPDGQVVANALGAICENCDDGEPMVFGPTEDEINQRNRRKS